MNRIHEIDPVMFRQVMKDLQYDGDEPMWAKFDFMEKLNLGEQEMDPERGENPLYL